MMRDITKNIVTVIGNQYVRQLVSMLLTSAGYRSIEAVDGKDALNKVCESDIYLVIADFRVPKIGTVEFLKELRKTGRQGSVPIVMLTSQFLALRRGKAQQLGVSDWVAKPLIRHHLIPTVERLVAGRMTV